LTGLVTIPATHGPLAIPPWVGAMSTGVGFDRRWGRNGEFCVEVGPVTSSAVILV